MKILSKQATAAMVAPFGGVVKSPAGTPATSEATDYKFWSDIAHYRIDGETEIGLCTVYALPGQAIGSMERHLRTPEILIPVDAPFAVPLMREGESLPTAFVVNIGEALVISPAVWHGACVPVGKQESSYFVIFRRGTPLEDVEKKKVNPFELENG
jgi:ureidoglycolate hydrolase